MPRTNLSVNEQTTRNLGRPETKPNGKTGEGISPRPTPVSRARRLDVDAVLARSLPRVVNE